MVGANRGGATVDDDVAEVIDLFDAARYRDADRTISDAEIIACEL